MAAIDEFSIGSATVEVLADTLSFEQVARVMGKHFTAMADELAVLRESGDEDRDR